MHVAQKSQKKVSDSQELELQMVISYYMSPGPLQEHPVLLIAEPSLQTMLRDLTYVYKNYSNYAL